jgi:hypothetical protein
MNKARQTVIIQNANMTLVEIRQLEINYFIYFFGSFGIQSAVLAGQLVLNTGQTPNYDCSSGCTSLCYTIYFISIAVGTSFCMICLLMSVFIRVFAQGLSIRGPPGSMITAVQGMFEEQSRVIAYIIGGVVSFSVWMFALNYRVLDFMWALICSGIVFLSACYTYRCALRIYNRFKF